MFKLIRYYAWISLIAVVATAFMLVGFYRQVAVQGVVDLARPVNLTLARTAVNTIRPALLEFLQASADARPTSSAPLPLPPPLVQMVDNLMQDRAALQIDICNRRGVVVFSSRNSRIGRDEHAQPGFISAINGRESNTLIYRGSFASAGDTTAEDNLMHSYVPVRASRVEPPRGVVEVYTDASDLVHEAERVGFVVIFGAVLILMLLYGTLLLVVRHVGSIVEQQQRAVRERTECLELLAAQMLESEECYKKKIAFELHEGLAQTLSAVKLHLENNGNDEPPAALVPALQGAIRDARTIAAQLHPSAIDDFGLLLTVDRLCRDLAKQHRRVRFERQIALQENEIPVPLKVILYRVIASALAEVLEHTRSDVLHLALWREGGTLKLLIDDTASEALDRTVIPLGNIDPQTHAGLARMEELTTLSGGEFSASHRPAGGTTLRAAWSF